MEKADGTGNVSYDPTNHSTMTDLRQAKVDGIANDIPLAELDSEGPADVLLVGWGSTQGAIVAATNNLRADGASVDRVHLTHIHPFPPNLGELLKGYTHVIVPELNKGQLVRILRAEYLVDAKPISKMIGLPFTASELVKEIRAIAGLSLATPTGAEA
ncbi:MAG: hypothetical protein R2706_11995 [Acidimicrobiales bacterium]